MLATVRSAALDMDFSHNFIAKWPLSESLASGVASYGALGHVPLNFQQFRV